VSVATGSATAVLVGAVAWVAVDVGVAGSADEGLDPAVGTPSLGPSLTADGDGVGDGAAVDVGVGDDSGGAGVRAAPPPVVAVSVDVAVAVRRSIGTDCAPASVPGSHVSYVDEAANTATAATATIPIRRMTR